MSLPVISVEDAGKKYVKYIDAPLLITRLARIRASRKRESLWALRNASLEVQPGEVLGIVGRNGSGKSTLLRMIAGVTAPSEGAVEVRGSVAPLISVGVGFHPELTGRENIYVNGAILGMSRSEIDDRFDEIIAFAEIGDFIDTPVKFYSSGMFVRLGFSVAAISSPAVLVVDEVLAVGDLAFQVKSFERMQQLCDSGAAVVIVSHNLNAIRRMCSRTVVLHNGSLRFDGPTAEALAVYHELLGEDDEPDAPIRPGTLTRDLRATIESFSLGGVESAGAYLDAGGRGEMVATVRFDEAVDHPCVGIDLYTADGVKVFGHSTLGDQVGSFAAGSVATFRIGFDACLTSQSYTAYVGLRDHAATVEIAMPASISFYVNGADTSNGVVDLNATYVVDRPES